MGPARRFAPALLAAAAALAASLSPAGVGNFHQVDDHVYRGAQPSPAGFHSLAQLGIRVVIDLREESSRSRTEQKLVAAEGMLYLSFPLAGTGAPSGMTVEKVLDLLENPANGPVFVHCRRGADRTGTIIASYRIEQDHWSNAQALAEARSFGMSRLEKAMQHYILDYRPRMLLPATQLSSPFSNK